MRKIVCAAAMAIAIPATALGATAGPAAPAQRPVSQIAEELHELRGYDTTGDPATALRHIDAVLERARSDRRADPVDLLYAQAVRASALSSLDRSEEALALFRQVDAQLNAHNAPMTPDRASLLQHIGSELGAQGKLDEAVAMTRDALALAEKTAGRDSPEYADALYGLAILDYQMGRQQDAIPKLEEALATARAYSLRTGENLEIPATYGFGLAALQLNTADAETAVVTAREAVNWAENHLAPNHRVRIQTVQQLGAILSEAGQFGQAIPILRTTLEERSRILPPDSPQVAMALHVLAYALDNAGMRAEAKPLYDRAVAIFEAKPARDQVNGLATMIGQQARIARWEGDVDKALALREKALAVARKYSASPDDQIVLIAELNLADTLTDAGRIAEARPLIDHAREGLTKGTSPTNKKRISATVLAARIEARTEDPAAALVMLREALAPLRARLLDRATARGDVLNLADEFRSAFMQLARIAVRNGAQDQAFDALQMANLGDLQGAFSSLAVLQNDYGPEARETIRRYLGLSARSRQLRKALDQTLIRGDDKASTDLQAQIATIDAQLREADAQVAVQVPGYAALTAVEPAKLADARKRLGDGQGIVLIGADRTGLVTFLVTRDAIALGEARVSSRHLLELQQRLRSSVDTGLLDNGDAAFDRAAAFELYQLLFPQSVRGLLRSVKELEILAPGSLSTVPFSALVTRAPKGSDADAATLRKTRWLVRDHAVSVMISASPLPRRTAGAARDMTFAGIGAPLLGPTAPLSKAAITELRSSDDLGTASLNHLASLPGAAEELRSMAGYFGSESQLLIGNEATETAVKQAPLDKARVIAFATHGLVGGALRGVVEPALVMTPPAVSSALDDGLLTASEVAQLRLDADWVILSACDTSAGDSENAPTYSGLARAFIAAGSRALLLSHWPVRDDVASRLTLMTVDGARQGLSRAEALRRAQITVLRDKSVPGGAHPASWAPFVLVGD